MVEAAPFGGNETKVTYTPPAASICGRTNVTAGPTCEGGLIVTARSKLTPRSRETAMRTFVALDSKTDQAAYTWSWKLLPRMWFTATHCLSSTSPSCLAEALGDCSRSSPPLPLTQV